MLKGKEEIFESELSFSETSEKQASVLQIQRLHVCEPDLENTVLKKAYQ